MKEAVVQAIRDTKVVAILRGLSPEDSVKAADALYEGGIRVLEIPFLRTVDEKTSISRNREVLEALFEAEGTRMHIGVGTMLTKTQFEAARSAGAEFFLSPVLDEDLIRMAAQAGMVSIPGTWSPTEIYHALRAGADFIKIFPASNVGSGYFKAVTGSMGPMPLLAVGGIRAENAAEFMRSGAVGVGMGGNLVDPRWVREGTFDKMTAYARNLVDIVRNPAGPAVKA